MFPRRLPSPALPLSTPSTSGARPASAAGDNTVSHGAVGLTSGGKIWQLPLIGTLVVPPRADAPASSFKDANIDAVLTMLSQHRDPQAFMELPDAEGGRQIQCRFPPLGNAEQSHIVATLRLEHHHNHHWLRELMLQRLDARGNKMEEHQAQFQSRPRPPAAVTPQTPAPGWLTASLAGSAAASGRKRPLPLPLAPRATRARTDADILQAAPAISPRTHAALQRQTQIHQAIATALDHFGMTEEMLDQQQQQALIAAATHLPPASSPSGMTDTAIRQHQLHAVLTSIQTARIMTWFASQRQLTPQVIAPALLNTSIEAVHYGGVTIDGPHVDHAGQRHFYLEQQCGHACAQHAVNAMVGGPLVSLMHFAQWEATVQAQRGAPEVSMEDRVLLMLEQGVHPETVHGTLQERGIPMHAYVHSPVPNAQGLLVLDREQAHFLDSLQTDRLLLQADWYEGEGATSHYVAFRRDGGQWVLLDSMYSAPEDVAPSNYLLRNKRIKHFTAIWPQNSLRGHSASVDVDRNIFAPQDEVVGAMHEDDSLQGLLVPAPPTHARIACTNANAANYWSGHRAKEFEPLRQAWNEAMGYKASGAIFLRHLSAKCDEALAAGGGKAVDEAGLIVEFEVQTHAEGAVVRVWRGLDGNGSINLRLAPEQGNAEAYQALLKAMQEFMKRSAGRRVEKSKGVFSYATSNAKSHWTGPRAKEFEPLWQAWNKATGNEATGATFLRHLSAKCDEALAAGGGKAVDEAGLIVEFEVQTHAEGAVVRVWRGLDGNGSINLRLAPEQGNDEAYQALLTSMQEFMKRSADRRVEKSKGVFFYSTGNANSNWTGPRAKEFEPVRQAWNKATGNEATGATFLRHLSAKCDEALAAGGGKAVDEAGLIVEFEVQTHAEGAVVRVWRGLDGNGSINLRLAPEQGNDEAYQALLKAMQEFMKRSADRRVEKSQGVFFYATGNANKHWTGPRAKEFEPVRQAWNEATGNEASGATFLQHLSAKCDEALAAGGGKAVDEAGLIVEFEVQTHAEGAVVRVWRGLDGNGSINLRLAPEQGNAEAYQALLKAMQEFMKRSAGQRVEKSQGSFSYSVNSATNHWTGPRAKEFEPVRQAWNEATGNEASGATFLQHLSAKCDEALAAGGGKAVDEAGLIVEFEVQTHAEGAVVRVWRGLDGNGSINLRLAPEQGNAEAYQALLKAMQEFMKRSAGRRVEKSQGVFSYATSNTNKHWNGPRAKEFELLRQAWNEVTGNAASGATFLQHLSAKCDEALAAGGGKAVDEAGLIVEFEVQTHAEGAVVRVWRGLDGNGSINLRLAPEQGNADAYQALLKAMQEFMKRSASQRGKRTASLS